MWVNTAHTIRASMHRVYAGLERFSVTLTGLECRRTIGSLVLASVYSIQTLISGDLLSEMRCF